MRDRRTFLKSLAAAGTALMARPARLFGQERVARLDVPGGAIDVHHHFVPPGHRAFPRPWSVQASLDQMERFGIGVAILSMTQNADLLYDGAEKGRTGRFGALIALQ